jgi:diguanylate cyclase (GGDEF)-like protein
MLFERGTATRSRRETVRATPARLRAWAGRRTGLVFGARLTVTLAVTLGLVGALGYVKLSGVLERRVIEQDAVYQRARAEALEAVARDHEERAVHAEIADVHRSMALIALLAVFGGGAIFYLVGGRTLTRAHRRALERATLDGLTDLRNQRAFQEDLAHAVALATRQGHALSLAVVDIDDFRFLNERHGHRYGDDVLLRVAGILRRGRASDRAFRIGGDEFAVLLTGTALEQSNVPLCRLQDALAAARVAASIGVSSLRRGQEAATLRDEADAALYEAKRQGGNAMARYADISESVAITTTSKVEALRALLDDGVVDMAFQPIWDLERGSLLGVEALARPAERYGFSGPAEAFDIAEQAGWVHELDVLCVQSALRRATELPPEALLFINIAPRTLDLDAHSDGWLVAAVERSGIDPERVVVEVTERFGGRVSSVIKSLDRLRAAGLQLALDDVGAGNSGLEMLSRLNVEFVKIDRSVVNGAITEHRARAVLLAMATFANETGASVIAEGIEDVATLRFLDGLPDDPTAARPRIHAGQGYGLGRPDSAFPGIESDLLPATARV